MSSGGLDPGVLTVGHERCLPVKLQSCVRLQCSFAADGGHRAQLPIANKPIFQIQCEGIALINAIKQAANITAAIPRCIWRAYHNCGPDGASEYFVQRVHYVPTAPLNRLAASMTACTISTCVPQRHKLNCRALLTSSSVKF